MSPRMPAALAALCLLIPAAATAQTKAEVTLRVPLNLTKLSTDIERVYVVCTLTSNAFSAAGPGGGSVNKQLSIPASNGQVVDTASVVFSASLDPAKLRSYPTASYQCRLSGFSASLQRADAFSDSHATAAFRLSPTPAVLSGSFNW